ncbi:MAG: dihydrofolate reductase [Actinomycetota bacterium]|nr:dihydrofolate reductase [Actinomycetota bacterium]
MTLRVLVSCRQMQSCFDEFRGTFVASGVDPYLPKLSGQQMTADELCSIIGEYHGVIAGDDHFTRSVLERAPVLRVISKWGVGLDAIDQHAARELGIAIVNTPNMFDEEVADVSIGYLIMLARKLHRIDAAMRTGEWLKSEGRSLGGLTLGIVGLGGIGLATARRALAMTMSVVGSDPSPVATAAATSLGVNVLGFDEVMRVSDALVLNCPLTHETRGLLNARVLAQARPGLLIVNTARGPVIDEAALTAALLLGRVAGAALDVFEREPLAADSPLRSMDQVILGSHNASNTREAVLRTSALAVENLFRHLEGER